MYSEYYDENFFIIKEEKWNTVMLFVFEFYSYRDGPHSFN